MSSKMVDPYAPVEVRRLDADSPLGPERIPDRAIYVGNQFQSVVSKKYKLITNQSLMESVYKALNKHGYEYHIFEQSFNGKKFNCRIEITSHYLLMSGEDRVHPILHVYNSYDKTMAQSIAIAGMRHICTNYLFISNPMVLKHVHHEEQFDGYLDPDEICWLLDENIKKFYDQEIIWAEMIKFQFDTDKVFELVNSINGQIPQVYKDKVVSLLLKEISLSRPLNAWRVMNAFSYVITSNKKRDYDIPRTKTGVKAIPGIQKQVDYMKIVDERIRDLVNGQ